MTSPIARDHAARTIRWFHLALGAWLIASAFLLPHTEASFGNTWIMGLFTAILAVVAIAGGGQGPLRVNAVFALWLLVSTLVVPYESSVTQLHNALAAVGLFVLSVVPARYLQRGDGREPQRATT